MARARRGNGPAGKSQGKGAGGKNQSSGAGAKVQGKTGGAKGQHKGGSGFSGRQVQAQPARPQLARPGKGQSQRNGAKGKGKGAGVQGVRKAIGKPDRRPPQPPPRPLRQGRGQPPQPQQRFGKNGRGPAQPAKGKGKGQWVWVPPGRNLHAVVKKSPPAMPKKNQPGRFARASAKVASIRGGRGGKSGRAARRPESKSGDEVRAIDVNQKVWVGGLSPETTSKELEEHFAEGSAKPKAIHMMKGGKAVVAYDSVEEVDAAVEAMNGSDLGGNAIEVDVWVEKPKPERGERPPREKKQPMKAAPKAVIKKDGKGKQKGKQINMMSDEAAAKMKEKLAAFEPSQKVWIGGLAETTTWKALAKHLETVAKPKVTHIMPRGKACACFESEDDVEAVIAELSNSELDGNTMKIHHWGKPANQKRQRGKGKAKEEVDEE